VVSSGQTCLIHHQAQNNQLQPVVAEAGGYYSLDIIQQNNLPINQALDNIQAAFGKTVHHSLSLHLKNNLSPSKLEKVLSSHS
jgi:hypothetical protein